MFWDEILPSLLFLFLVLIPVIANFFLQKGDKPKAPSTPQKEEPRRKTPPPQKAPWTVKKTSSGSLSSSRPAASVVQSTSQSLKRIEALGGLKKAVVWKEILDKPKGLG